MASIRAAGGAICTCEICTLLVDSATFFGTDDGDEESRALEDSGPDISDHLPKSMTEQVLAGSSDSTDNIDRGRIFFQEERDDVSGDFVAHERRLCEEYKDIFSESVRAEPARVPPMDLQVDPEVLRGKLHARARPQSLAKVTKLRELLATLLKFDIIRVSKETKGSQVLLVDKKGTDKMRFVSDYRALNEATRAPEGWPIPNIAEILQEIGVGRPKFFATLDMTSGYHQAPLKESVKHFTAFVTPGGGMYEWNRVAMGLMGAGSYFQRVMATSVFADLLHKGVKIYLDDIIIYADTEEEFLRLMKEVFERCRRANIILKPSKCRFGMAEVEFVGHKISQDGISFTEERIDAVTQIPLPTTAFQLKSFLGLANYFHSHIRNLSALTEPLSEMLGKYEKKNSHRRLEWTPKREAAFHAVKEAIHACPKLFFVRLDLPIYLQTDSSDYGIGAYLFQKDGDIEYPVAFLSKSLNKEQRKWAIPDKEAYAIFYTIKKWDHLLRDAKFTLQTDHKNLVYINFEGTAKVRRWKLLLQEYNFQWEYIKGETNLVADWFSRLITNGGADDTPTTTTPATLAAEQLLFLYQEIDSQEEMLAAFDEDVAIPKAIYDELRSAHNVMVGHGGVQRTVAKLNRQGSKMKYKRQYAEKFIKECGFCQKVDARRTAVHVRPVTLATYRAMQRINIDAMGPFPVTELGFQYILVVIDTFSRWVMLYPTRSLTAQECAWTLVQHFGLFGVAAEVLSDGGPQLDNATVRQTLELLGAQHNLSIAYSSEENGIVERENKEVLRYVQAFVYDTKRPAAWDETLPFVQRILNAEVVASTGVSPADIVFGQAISLDRGVLVPNKVIECSARPELQQYVRDLIEVQQRVIALAASIQKETDERHVVERGGKAITEFAVNSYVTLSYPDRAPSKVMTARKGPFLVVSSSNHEYVLEDLVGGKKVGPVHVTRLKKFVFDATREDPQEIATHDNMEFYVEAVLDHEPKHQPSRHRRDLVFLIKWLGYDDSHNSWEPWAELRANRVVHAYMRANTMASIISTIYADA